MTGVFSDPKFFGRTLELKRLIVNILIGKHTLITGKKGIGKTRLVEEAVSIIKGKVHKIDITPRLISREFNDIRLAKRLKDSWEFYSYLQSKKPSTPREALFNQFTDHTKIVVSDASLTKSSFIHDMIQQIYNYRDIEFPDDLFDIQSDAEEETLTVKTKSIHDLQQIIIKSIDSKRYCVIIDNIDALTSSMVPFLTELIKTTTIVATFCGIREEKKLRPVISSFEKIDLTNLDKSSANLMTEYLIDKYIPGDLHPVRKKLLKNEVTRTARGNPHLIKSIIQQAQAEKYIKERNIKKFRSYEDTEYINLGPVYALLIGTLTVLKILQLGLQNREAYILLSIFSFIGYLIFRVFRYFFYFRPQRRR